MYAISQKYGVAMPALRPAELATDHAKTVDVVLQAMDTVPFPDGYVLLVQATSPLRTLEDLNGFCRTFDEDKTGASAIVTLVRHDSRIPTRSRRSRTASSPPTWARNRWWRASRCRKSIP